MALARIVIGGLLLLLGRKLFWLYVAACGFILGLTLTTRMVRGEPEWLALLVGLGAGLLGALLAVAFQGLAIGVGGLVAGAFIALTFAEGLGLAEGPVLWGAAILGGVLGAILLLALFNWGLILVSSLLGASLILPALRLPRAAASGVWLGLLLLGVVVQAAMVRHETV